ncbi:hypothetical protein [Anatilimnocola floriformis]|uniref:hypothetical protein n=1 Tax=Anatilimnocola floriformis TaxID=2948575 RepID=UPI0020C54E54|nr:hypothetical protein [Anatilimnocola floriformis]
MSPAHHAFLAWLLITLGLLPLAGCGGCWNSNPQSAQKKTPEEELEEQEKKKKKAAEKPKPDFEMQPTIILPNDVGQDVEDDGNPNKPPSTPKVVFFTKPGHWVAGMQQAKANNFDFQGELRTYPMDQFELPLDVEHTDFRLSISRPASLPKGQIKRFETLFFLPKRGEASKSYSLRTELRAGRGSRLPEMINVAGNALREHEYYFVVLAKNQASYVDLTKLDSLQLQGSDLGSFATTGQQPATRFYHAVFPRVDKSVPLPSHPLAWTMIAYILWDDLDPTVLTKEQQTALLDWLHWGGQLIISGPNSLDRLKQTFLEPYLPATSGQAKTIGANELADLNTHWSLKERKPLKKPAHITVLQDKPLVGVELQKQGDAEWIPDTGELAIERRLGQGRIVVTAFSLSAMPYRFWASRDNFFNNALLRRPSRNFELRNEELHMQWAGSMKEAKDDDARLGTRLRFFSRDIGRMRESIGAQPGTPPPPTAEIPEPTKVAQQHERRPPAMLSPSLTSRDVNDERHAGYRSDQLAGIGGWNDFSGAADAALAALNDASGIKIPRADFVLKVLVVYLLVLVPLNWLVFWLIGRVEYAWAAAPVIAIVGALAVVRLAQLDIGFARSRSEIAVLESHANYPRAHVTRFTALYTSLSTSYDLRFEDPDALALPFALSSTHARRETRPAADVVLTQDQTIELSDVQVQSNSTGKLHTEQMIDLPASFIITGDDQRGWQLENGSQFTLRQAGVLRKIAREQPVDIEEKRVVPRDQKDEPGVVEENGLFYKKTTTTVTKMVENVEAAYFPDIEAGATVRLNFLPTADNHSWVPQWDRSPMMSPLAPVEDENHVSLHRLTQHAARQLELFPGEMRLIAWTTEPIPGLRITPASAQSTTYTLVLVHLQRPQLPKPEQDVRLRVDVMQDEVKPETDTEPN